VAEIPYASKFTPFAYRNRWPIILVVVAVVALGVLVWPTPYWYTNSNGSLIRINRITGHASKMTSTGWYDLGQPPEFGNQYELVNPPPP